jgi:competence protein ComEA
MKNFRSHFVFSRGQQNGIFLLVGIIILMQLLYFFYPFSLEENPNQEEEENLVRALQLEIDSLKSVAVKEKDSLRLAPFNPNFISDYKGYVLGMSLEEIDRLHEYRKKELWVNSSLEFQAVTNVSDSLLRKISPYFKFPEWRQSKPGKAEGLKKGISEAYIKKLDLNVASAEDLQKINGIGDKLSARILKYRHSIGGFRGASQVQDIYGLSPEVIQRLLEKFEVREGVIDKHDLNSIEVLPLSELPYFDYELARKIVNYRKDNLGIHSFEELANIPGFPVEKLDRIKLYLAIN